MSAITRLQKCTYVFKTLSLSLSDHWLLKTGKFMESYKFVLYTDTEDANIWNDKMNDIWLLPSRQTSISFQFRMVSDWLLFHARWEIFQQQCILQWEQITAKWH